MATIAVIACVRNEADIIEAFVRHALTFADRVALADHGSIDGTADIARALAAEGLPVVLTRMEDGAQRQAAALNDLMAGLDAGWTVPLDADEFLVSPGGSVRAVLEALPTDAAVLARMRHYLPDGRRLAFDASPAVKVAAVPRTLAKRGVLTQGNHGLLVGGNAVMRPAPELAIAHVPFRSAAQAQAKALGWISHLLRTDLKEEEAYNWKELFGALLAGRLETPADVASWALKYPRYLAPDCPLELTEDPLPAVESRYADLAGRAAPRAILERVASQLGLAPEAWTTIPDLARAAAARARWLQEAQMHIDRAAASS